MVNKIFKIFKEILNTGLSTQQMIVILLFGGFAFLIQAISSPNPGLAIGYLFYVVIAMFFFIYMNWEKSKK